MAYSKPFPIFDESKLSSYINFKLVSSELVRYDFKIVSKFLKQYDKEKRLIMYRCEIERLLLWTWLVAKKSVLHLEHQDFPKYIAFCLDPPNSWIGIHTSSHFIKRSGIKKSNRYWRPFTVTIIKKEHQGVESLDKNKYQLSQEGIRRILNVLEKFYNFLLLKRKIPYNSIALALTQQKNQYGLKKESLVTVKRLTEIQWQYCFKTAKQLAAKDPGRHEKTLFIITLFYFLYPRSFELTARSGWTPQMNHFYQDNNKNWWFKVIGKRNKMRNVSVSNDMLEALKRYRLSRGLMPLPSLTDSMPLLPEKKGNAITCSRIIDWIVRYCFDKAIQELRKDNLANEAETLALATITNLRHTGILDDINKRGYSINQVRAKAGQPLSAITDQSNEIPLEERRASAKNKKLIENFNCVKG